MGFFNPISFDLQFNLAQYITGGNSYVPTKYQVPLGMSELKKFNFNKMVKPKNEIGLF